MYHSTQVFVVLPSCPCCDLLVLDRDSGSREHKLFLRQSYSGLVEVDQDTSRSRVAECLLCACQASHILESFSGLHKYLLCVFCFLNVEKFSPLGSYVPSLPSVCFVLRSAMIIS